MDMRAMFQIQCGLFVAAVGLPDKVNGCVTNTLMQQSHMPAKLSLTLEKSHLTHDMVVQKGTVGVSAFSDAVTVDTIRRFGFVSGRDVDKFAGFTAYEMDPNGNPLLTGGEISACYSLKVYDTVDVGTHTLFLCTADDARNLGGQSITYSGYQASLKKKG